MHISAQTLHARLRGTQLTHKWNSEAKTPSPNVSPKYHQQRFAHKRTSPHATKPNNVTLQKINGRDMFAHKKANTFLVQIRFRQPAQNTAAGQSDSAPLQPLPAAAAAAAATAAPLVSSAEQLNNLNLYYSQLLSRARSHSQAAQARIAQLWHVKNCSFPVDLTMH